MWSTPSVTLFAGTLRPTLSPTSRTAPMRCINSEPCRGCCELCGFPPTLLGHERAVYILSFCVSLSLSKFALFSCYRSKNPVFKEALTRIEGHTDCRNLPMISFLILPMQRITRLPLLMDVSEFTLGHTQLWDHKMWSTLSNSLARFMLGMCTSSFALHSPAPNGRCALPPLPLSSCIGVWVWVKVWFWLISFPLLPSGVRILPGNDVCVCNCFSWVMNRCVWRAPWTHIFQTICQKTQKDSVLYEECKKALQAVSKVSEFTRYL